MSGRRFYVGQPVVCVDDKWGPFWRSPWARGLARPVKGQKYHVHSYIEDAPPPISINVREISNPKVKWSDGKVRDAGFAEFRFAPITENQVQAIIAQSTDVPALDDGNHQEQKEDEEVYDRDGYGSGSDGW